MPEPLANQIAAGEVVERPASCVKELVENSLDAGARQIRVELEEGGIARIVVQDDGEGMDRDDLLLACARHATSKIRQARDLYRVQTLGFRGEALAAIAAVAHVTLASRPPASAAGQVLTWAGGQLVSGPAPIGMPPGTRVEVRELFYNTPARLKYLRSVQTEQARCLEVLQRAALARPDVAFQCVVNGHVTFRTPGDGQPLSVLAALYGPGEAGQLLSWSASDRDFTLHAWLGRPAQAKSSRQHGYLFLNTRPIRNVALQQAVTAGYGQRLMVGRYPLFALYLTLDPGLVDVNVHPHKTEVRLSEERDLASFVQAQVAAALAQAQLVPSGPNPRQVAEHGRTAPPSTPHLGLPLSKGRGQTAGWPSGSVMYAQQTGLPLPSTRSRPQTDDVLAALAPARAESAVAAWPGQPVPAEQVNEHPEPVATGTASHDAGRLPALRLVGQALGLYILAEDGEHLYIIDQHAAHERVLYERFLKRLQSRHVRPLPLLTPLPLVLTPGEYAAVCERQAELQTCGLEVEPFGGSDVVVRSVPDIWEGLDLHRLAEDVLRQLAADRSAGVVTALQPQLALQACKAAVKANQRLSLPELEALCSALAEADDPFHCPHGRPVLLRLSQRDLEKGFRRIV
ncbi:MAG: DNA mismatch repair endonuclease MutL [Alicyclobacillus sp.]|nr:DNA mismatch repair endonuclease MutL [Alicyclobacillus sp.]